MTLMFAMASTTLGRVTTVATRPVHYLRRQAKVTPQVQGPPVFSVLRIPSVLLIGGNKKARAG